MKCRIVIINDDTPIIKALFLSMKNFIIIHVDSVYSFSLWGYKTILKVASLGFEENTTDIDMYIHNILLYPLT